MSLEFLSLRKLSAELGVSDVELSFQVLSLEGQLTRRHIQAGFVRSGADPGAIKTETAPVRLISDMVEITVNRTARRWSGLKSLQLRVVLVSPCLTHQDLSSEKPLSPKGDESL